MSGIDSMQSEEESWLSAHWRPMAAMVYLVICMTDFVFMPIYYELSNARLAAAESISLATKLDSGTAQIEALKVLRQQRRWEPITLSESGLLHISFGAILGVAAWTRGQAQIERQRQMPPNSMQ